MDDIHVEGCTMSENKNGEQVLDIHQDKHLSHAVAASLSLETGSSNVPFSRYQISGGNILPISESGVHLQPAVRPLREDQQLNFERMNDVFMKVDGDEGDTSRNLQTVAFSTHPADLVNINKRSTSQWSSSHSNLFPIDDMSSASIGSSNTTENVRVYSSFHVAEIVGKQGVKIKRIRANTNTWIKTPARGQDPIFIISGRHEGVKQAKAEILASNEKVSKLRELRGRNVNDVEQMDVTSSSVTNENFAKDAVVLQVSVPSSAVGLVIGPKGSRISEIADATDTYIKTPCRYREPVFEIHGRPSNVIVAKEQILSFVHDKTDDEYIQQWMSQMPIHEPGTPVIPGFPAPPVKSMSTLLPAREISDACSTSNNFTKLRPCSPHFRAPVTSPFSPNAGQMYSDFGPSYSSLSSWNPRLSPTNDPMFLQGIVGAHRPTMQVDPRLSGRTTPTSFQSLAPSVMPPIADGSQYRQF